MLNSQDLLVVLDLRIRDIALEVFAEQSSVRRPPLTNDFDPEVAELRAKLQRILAKEFVSIAEAATLLGCSDGHIRNQVRKARKGKTKRPIPFRDLDGVTIFRLGELLAWSEQR
jgi:hypothetical protein